MKLLSRITSSHFGGTAVLLSAVVGALTWAHDASAQQSRRRASESGYSSRIDTTFAFDKSGSVNVMATNGDIIITGWARNEVRVHAVSDDDNIRFDATSTRVMLDVSGSRRGSDTRFEVSVPYGTRVITRSASGDVSVRGTRGQVEAASQSGDVRIDDVATRLDATTMSGDVEVQGVSGDVVISTLSGGVTLNDARGGIDVGTVSGDIDLRAVTSKTVRAKTTSGDVSYDGSIDPTGRYDLSTHSGDVDLRIPRDASAQLTVSTWSGSIDSQFAITLQPGQHSISVSRSKLYTFAIGAGGARISAETFSGDITITARR